MSVMQPTIIHFAGVFFFIFCPVLVQQIVSVLVKVFVFALGHKNNIES